MRERRLQALRRWAAEQWPRWLLGVLVACALWPLAGRGQVDGTRTAAPHEWPSTWHGQGLRPLALTAVEQRFAHRFPGHVGRFASADGDVWVLRDVARPTRALHPAGDCFRGLGWRIEQTRLEREADARLWRCFVAERQGQRVRVCERIVDADDRDFVDASSWYWAALLGRSSGPWRAMTRVESL
ncbi:MAG TPA: hypothetical protein VLE45_06115 [Burkholderiaceae bacterium]|nr:hypothetical protein [Burkholderiaceae bacterium]